MIVCVYIYIYIYIYTFLFLGGASEREREMSTRKIAYFYDSDVGNFHYGMYVCGYSPTDTRYQLITTNCSV